MQSLDETCEGIETAVTYHLEGHYMYCVMNYVMSVRDEEDLLQECFPLRKAVSREMNVCEKQPILNHARLFHVFISMQMFGLACKCYLSTRGAVARIA